MNKYYLFIFFCLWVAFPISSQLLADEQVIINISGRINKFVRIESSNTHSNIDLEANYDINSGTLPSSQLLINMR